MNIIAYIIYLTITYLITVQVGHVFYKNGSYFIITLLKGNTALATFINKTLLAGYYLVNLGYATIMLSFWRTVYTYASLVASVTNMVSKILIGLAILHFFNMLVLYILSKKHNLHHHKTNQL